MDQQRIDTSNIRGSSAATAQGGGGGSGSGAVEQVEVGLERLELRGEAGTPGNDEIDRRGTEGVEGQVGTADSMENTNANDIAQDQGLHADADPSVASAQMDPNKHAMHTNAQYVPVEVSGMEYVPQHTDPNAHSNLYVKNLPENVDDTILHNLFAPYGIVISSFVMVDGATRQSRGFGFVKYANVEMAIRAIHNMNNMMIAQDKQLVVKFANSDAMPRSDHSGGGTPSDNIFVKCLPLEFTEDDLRNLFGQYGTVADCKLLLAADNSSRCQGLVRFSGIAEAQHAIAQANGLIPMHGSSALIVRFADTPTEKARKHRVAMDHTRHGLQPYPFQKPYGSLPASLEGMPMPNGMGTMHGDPSQVAWSPHHQGMGHGIRGNGMGTVTSIVVKGLPQDSDDLLLYRLFAPHGAITSVKTLRDDTGKCKGIAFVNFCHAQEAARGVQANDGKQVGDRMLKVFLQGERQSERGRPMHNGQEGFVMV